MRPDFTPTTSPEFRYPECDHLLKALLKCHEENVFGKLFGACEKENVEMEKCTLRAMEERYHKYNPSKITAEPQKEWLLYVDRS